MRSSVGGVPLRRPRSPPLASRASHRRSASSGFVAALAARAAALAAPRLTRASARLSRTGARRLAPPASRHAAFLLALRRMRLGEACLPPSKTGFTPSYLAFWRVTGKGSLFAHTPRERGGNPQTMAGPFSRRMLIERPMSVGGRSRGKRRVFPARHDWRRAINLADFGRKQKKRALFTSRTSCRRVAGKSSELALGTAAGANTSPASIARHGCPCRRQALSQHAARTPHARRTPRYLRIIGDIPRKIGNQARVFPHSCAHSCLWVHGKEPIGLRGCS